MTPQINISPSSALIPLEVIGFTYEYLSESFQVGLYSVNNCIFAFVKSVILFIISLVINSPRSSSINFAFLAFLEGPGLFGITCSLASLPSVL